METLIKQLQNIMRGDDLSGTVQYLKQMIWMIFLKIYDAQEEKWEILEDDYTSIIPDKLKWRNWAVDHKDGKALTGDELIKFVNEKVIDGLKKLEVNEYTPKRHYIVWQMFQDASNFMKNGTKLRQMINALNGKDFTNASDTHEFGDMYESMLKDLQESKRDGGEFYTPRALTDFIVEKVDPCLGEKIADFACGTGGFLVSALKHLTAKVQTTEDLNLCRHNLHGIEKKSFPYSLCMTNMILHDVDDPNIVYGNSLNKDVRDIKDSEKFDVILMNPPYGGSEDEIIQMNFPQEFRCAETANLFMAVIMYRLNTSGRVGVVLPDSFLFSTDSAERNLKEKLFSEFNLHTVLRLPKSVFAPYTPIATNVLFFEKDADGTQNTWFYRMDIPSDRKAFSKTKPIKSEHFQPVRAWWNNREEIQDEDGNFKAKRFSKQEIANGKYNLDLCGFPKKLEEILEPIEFFQTFEEHYRTIHTDIFSYIDSLKNLINNAEVRPKHTFCNGWSSSLQQLGQIALSLDEQLKKSILQYAIQGKLIPQCDTDETASDLLNRVRKEKTRLAAEGKVKHGKNESVILRSADGRYIERIGKTETDITDKILFDIPDSWEWTKIGDIFFHNNGKQLNKNNSSGQMMDYITTSNLYWDGFKLDNLKQMPFETTEIERCQAIKGDLLVCEGGDVGRSCIWNFDYPIMLQNHIHKLRGIIPVETKYFYYVLYLYNLMGIIGGKGIGIQGFSGRALHNTLIPLPPLQEQKRIVERIEQIFSLCK